MSNPADEPNLEAHDERAELRRLAIERRRGIDPQARAYRSDELCQQLLMSLDMTLMLQGFDLEALAAAARSAARDSSAIEGAAAGRAGVEPATPDSAGPAVAVYAAFPDEVDLRTFIEGAFARGVRVAFPVMVSDAASENDVSQTMEMHQVDEQAWRDGRVEFINHPLHTFTHDDPRLADAPYVSASQLAMAVVPLVAFDGEGNRLGYGGGNYDRYLTQLPESTRVVGAAFDEQRIDRVPVGEHDVALPIASI